MAIEMDANFLDREVREILSAEFNIPMSEITQESSLLNDLGVDSFKAVELVFHIREMFGVELCPEDLKTIKKVKDIVECISAKKSG